MRVLIGIIFGVALVVGGAWYVDKNRVGDLGGPLVNWERVDKGWADVRGAVRAQWRKLAG